MQPLVRYQKAHNVLVYIGEFSAVRWAPGRDQYIKDVIDIFEEHGWGWTYFALGGKKVWTGWDSRYEVAPGTPKRNLVYKGYDTTTWKLLKEYYKKNK